MPVFDLLFNQVSGLQICNFVKKDIPTQVLFGEYCKIFKNAYFEENL